MSAVSIIAMKISGAAFRRSGSIDSLGEPPPGIEMLSTPPATMHSAPSERIELAAIAMVCSPEEQKRLTGTPPVDFGVPARRAAGRPTVGAPCAQLPR